MFAFLFKYIYLTKTIKKAFNETKNKMLNKSS